jgi:hypothetical protein
MINQLSVNGNYNLLIVNYSKFKSVKSLTFSLKISKITSIGYM